jgi:hypothetical protein
MHNFYFTHSEVKNEGKIENSHQENNFNEGIKKMH